MVSLKVLSEYYEWINVMIFDIKVLDGVCVMMKMAFRRRKLVNGLKVFREYKGEIVREEEQVVWYLVVKILS